MTVSPTYNTITYTANGTTTNFPWTYDYDPTYGALVVKNETDDITYVEGTDYTIVDKTVIFNTAPANGKNIVLSRNTYRGQEVTFIEGEDFPAKDYETSLDRLFMIEQEQDKALADETAARIAADIVLQENIDTEEARAKSVEGTLSNLTTTAKSNLVAAINEVDAHANSISETISEYGNIVTHNVSEFATAAQGAKADTAVQPADLGNGTLTIKQGGVTKGTFTANQKTNATINLDAGGGVAGIIAIEDFIISEPVEGEEPSEGKQSISTVISDSRVEAERSYLPIFVSSINQRYMSCYLLYHTGTGVTSAKTVEMFCYHTTGFFRGFRGTLYLIPIETDEDGVIVGSTNGFYDCTESTGYTGDIFALNSEAQTDITTLSGYDATATQILKNINGTLTWVTEE